MYQILIGLSPYYAVVDGETELMNISLIEYLVLSSFSENGINYKLISNVNDYKYIALLRGKDLSDSEYTKKVEDRYLYKDRIDASIQMAYMCVKSGIKKDNIYRITNETITPEVYNKLSDLFNEEFPEKLI